jgi:hypothetical protein
MARFLMKATMVLSALSALSSTAIVAVGAFEYRNFDSPLLGGIVLLILLLPPYLVWPAFSWFACFYDRPGAAVATFGLGLFASCLLVWGLAYLTFVDGNEYWPIFVVVFPWMQVQLLAPVLGWIWLVIALDAIENPK